MHTIQFDAQTERELNRLAGLAGKNADQFIKDVVQDFLEDQEDIADAKAALLEQGEVSIERIKAEYGL
jgi:predicted DNA-binding protein